MTMYILLKDVFIISLSLIQGLLSVGVASTNSIIPGKDHYNLVEGLDDADSKISQTFLQFLGSKLWPLLAMSQLTQTLTCNNRMFVWLPTFLLSFSVP